MQESKGFKVNRIWNVEELEKSGIEESLYREEIKKDNLTQLPD